MDSKKNVNWNTKRWFIMTVICSALLLLFGSDCSAQTVTLTPGSVEIAKLQPIVLHITKADGSSDSVCINQVAFVKVGDQLALFQKDAERITITPPKLTPGKQFVQLLDKDYREIAKGELIYQNVSSGGEEARRNQLANSNWYYILVSCMFLCVLGPFVLAIYRGTSGSHTTGHRPLGLPVGSFRSILAYSLVAYLGFFVLTSILSVSQFAPPDFLLGIVATVIGFYFGSRAGDEGEASQKTGTVLGIVRYGTNPARGASVKFKRSADGTEPYSRISDLEGRFVLKGAAPGKYKVCASLTGSSPSDEQEISVAEGSDHEIEILIKSSDSVPPLTPQTGTVQGTVMKPDGTPAPQATVVFTQEGVEKAKKTTDTTGKYKIDTVAVGDYDIEASLSPYNPSEKLKVKVTSAEQSSIDLKLEVSQAAQG
ncbi:MAG: carboxypeptidase-like regulatory domain-containing protein [Proteobacteria bacterium]|nr:carboxypeptidase-like regulatory domain-containing protein [Pseudomonadota bacterium]MBU4297929.1 carboxypeptidase-like regulatory domain-containing protein [Pseudomonadota bacterium]MCG2747975.1 carboxypeptidase-like regulatory domain-containing protein [Desulfobulbaceae bacterium]